MLKKLKWCHICISEGWIFEDIVIDGEDCIQDLFAEFGRNRAIRDEIMKIVVVYAVGLRDLSVGGVVGADRLDARMVGDFEGGASAKEALVGSHDERKVAIVAAATR